MADPIEDSAVTFSAETEALQNNQQQYGRKLSLLVGDANGDGLDISALQVRFEVTSATRQTPRKLEARIYNVAPSTAALMQSEFVQVSLSAGYENGPFGLIFGGLIAQVPTATGISPTARLISFRLTLRSLATQLS